MRNKIWEWATRDHPEGQILTTWLMIVRAVLFPVDFIYWRLSKNRGYQWESDTWLIEGIRYSGAGLRLLAKAPGRLLRVVARDGDVITLEYVSVELADVQATDKHCPYSKDHRHVVEKINGAWHGCTKCGHPVA